jgi:hypothetical protein
MSIYNFLSEKYKDVKAMYANTITYPIAALQNTDYLNNVKPTCELSDQLSYSNPHKGDSKIISFYKVVGTSAVTVQSDIDARYRVIEFNLIAINKSSASDYIPGGASDHRLIGLTTQKISSTYQGNGSNSVGLTYETPVLRAPLPDAHHLIGVFYSGSGTTSASAGGTGGKYVYDLPTDNSGNDKPDIYIWADSSDGGKLKIMRGADTASYTNDYAITGSFIIHPSNT